MSTRIEWVRNADKSQGKTWNVVTGCSHAGGPGCDMCYARRMARRLAGRYGYPEYPHHFDVTLRPNRLDIPLRRKKPTTYFVCSMSDLFHKNVPPWFTCEVWQVMRECPQHTFQILTKRPKRMLRLIKTYIADHEFGIEPLPNIWLGVSCENQATADERIPLLLQTPAAVRFVSFEPLLEAVNFLNQPWWDWRYTLHRYNYYNALGFRPPINWAIVGGESGPGARPMDPDWARGIRDQCQGAGTKYFFKQWGRWLPLSQASQYFIDLYPAPKEFYDVGKKHAGRLLDGREWNEMPEVINDA